MRIAEINDVASVASEITSGLVRRGHEVELIHPRLYGAHLPDAIKPVVAPARLYDWANIVRRVRGRRFDLLHIHYAYLGMVGVLARKPYLLHCHGGDVWGLTPFTRPLAARALRSAAHVFYSTPNLAPYTHRYRPDAEFLPNPIDTALFAPTSAAGTQGGVYICCALDDFKGGRVLLEACRELCRTRPDIQVTVIGGGKYTPEFAALRNVRVLPFQRREELPRLIGEHGIVIGQMALGAAGMAELEAMACGRPVIHRFDFDAAYPEAPPFVRATTGVEIAAQVVRLTENPALRDEFGEKGRAWVQRYHDLDAVAARVEEVALAVLGKREGACGHAS